MEAWSMAPVWKYMQFSNVKMIFQWKTAPFSCVFHSFTPKWSEWLFSKHITFSYTPQMPTPVCSYCNGDVWDDFFLQPSEKVQSVFFFFHMKTSTVFKDGSGCLYAVWVNCFCFPWVEYKRTHYSICLLYNILWLKNTVRLAGSFDNLLFLWGKKKKKDMLNIPFCVAGLFSARVALWVNWLDADACVASLVSLLCFDDTSDYMVAVGWNSKQCIVGRRNVLFCVYTTHTHCL